MPLLHTTVASPIGELLLVADELALRVLYMHDGARPRRVASGWVSAEEPFASAREQLGQYFAGERTNFSLRLELDGPPLQAVWGALTEIGYAETASYGQIAKRFLLEHESGATRLAI